MKVKSESEIAKSCLTLSDPMDCSPPGSSIHGIFQARVLEWGAIAFSGNLVHRYLNYLNILQNTSLDHCTGRFSNRIGKQKLACTLHALVLYMHAKRKHKYLVKIQESFTSVKFGGGWFRWMDTLIQSKVWFIEIYTSNPNAYLHTFGFWSLI